MKCCGNPYCEKERAALNQRWGNLLFTCHEVVAERCRAMGIPVVDVGTPEEREAFDDAMVARRYARNEELGRSLPPRPAPVYDAEGWLVEEGT